MNAKKMILERYFGRVRPTQRRRAKLVKLIAADYPDGIPCPRELAPILGISEQQVYNDLAWLKNHWILDVPNDDDFKMQCGGGIATASGLSKLSLKGKEVAALLHNWTL